MHNILDEIFTLSISQTKALMVGFIFLALNQNRHSDWTEPFVRH